MSPQFATLDIPNDHIRYTELSCYRKYRSARNDQLPDYEDLLVVQFSLAVQCAFTAGLQPMQERMLSILLGCIPLQIAILIVCLDPIFVIDLCVRRRLSNESHTHKPVYRTALLFFSAFSQSNSEVSVTIRTLPQDHPRTRTRRWFNPSDLSTIRDFIKSLISWAYSPFFHNYDILPEIARI